MLLDLQIPAYDEVQVLFLFYSDILFVNHVYKIGENARQHHVLTVGQNLKELNPTLVK